MNGATAVPRRPRPLPGAPVVNADPDSPEVQAAIGGAKVERVIVGASVVEAPEPPKAAEVAAAAPAQTVPPMGIRVETPPPPERWLPKFSLVEEHATLLDEIAVRFRRASGQECSMSRIVAAGIVALAGMSESDLVKTIAKVPMRKAGRRGRGGADR
jgi:hypothetical protein